MKSNKGRLNDTAAIQAMPIDPVQRNEYSSREVRKISNGFITSESSNKDGEYTRSETFSAVPPSAMSDDNGGNPMAQAIRYMTKTGAL